MNANQDPAAAMEYEQFLRWAFGLKQDGIHLDRWGDPAGAADTDSFTPPNLAGVKAATAYAMKIYWNDIVNRVDAPQSDHDSLKKYVEDVINSSSLQEVSTFISSFNTSFVERYYERRDGKATFRKPNN